MLFTLHVAIAYWCVTLRVEQRVRVFENGVLWGVSGTKGRANREAVMGGECGTREQGK